MATGEIRPGQQPHVVELDERCEKCNQLIGMLNLAKTNKKKKMKKVGEIFHLCVFIAPIVSVQFFY